MESVPFFAPIFARGAELASRSDTGLRKQTGKGEAFTGGGMFFPPKMESVPFFAKAKPLLAAGCTSRQRVYISPSFITLTQMSKFNIIETRPLKLGINGRICLRNHI